MTCPQCLKLPFFRYPGCGPLQNARTCSRPCRLSIKAGGARQHVTAAPIGKMLKHPRRLMLMHRSSQRSTQQETQPVIHTTSSGFPTCPLCGCALLQTELAVQGGQAALNTGPSNRVSCEWIHPSKIACTAGRNLVQCQLLGLGQEARVVLLHSRPEGDEFVELARPSQVPSLGTAG